MKLLAPRSLEGDDREVEVAPADRHPSAHFSSRLNASDALLWTIERDPCLRSTIVAVSMLDRDPDWDRLRTRIADACRVIPRLRQKVAPAPFGLGPPRWELDRYFDLDYHLRRTAVPDGDLRGVLDVAGLIAMDAFDKDRPLWEFTLVEGLAQGRAALIQKLHHSVTDGVGGIALARLVLDDRRNPRGSRLHVREPDFREVGPWGSVAESFVHDLRSASTASMRGASAIPVLAARALSGPAQPVASLVRQARSVSKLLAPVTVPKSPIMTRRGMSRHLDAFDIPIEAMLTAAHVVDGSLNDAFLAAVAGGMRRYHDHHGAPVSTLRVTMPINLRRGDDPSGSNRFTPARFTLPISTVDAAQRMRDLGQLARDWRHEPSLPLTDVIAGALNRLPAAATTLVFGSMLKAIDFVATNIPGLSGHSYLAGAEITHEYAFAPASGAAFSIALLSHADQCCVGINADTAAVPDSVLMTTCLRQGFDEVMAVGTDHAGARR